MPPLIPFAAGLLFGGISAWLAPRETRAALDVCHQTGLDRTVISAASRELPMIAAAGVLLIDPDDEVN